LLLAAPSRQLDVHAPLKEGRLGKQGKGHIKGYGNAFRSYIPRQVVLTRHALEYYDPGKTQNTYLNLKGKISVRDIQSCKRSKHARRFTVVAPDEDSLSRRYHFECTGEDERDEWVDMIRDAVAEAKERSRSRSPFRGRSSSPRSPSPDKRGSVFADANSDPRVIPKEDIVLRQQIASGAHGSVCACSVTNIWGKFALKRVDRSAEAAAAIESLRTELKFLQRIRHEFVVELVGFSDFGDSVAIIMELCDNNLAGVVKKQKSELPGDWFPGSEVATWLWQVSQGLNYLHNGLDTPIGHRE
jgi:Protein kinase domain/PH domain